MNEGQLKTLLWVVRLGGIGAAAQHLNMTQPAITRRIQELEKELGAPVFRREGRNVVPTALGLTCLASAQRILSEVAAMRVAASGKSVVGTIRTGVSELIALTWFYRLLARIEERYPNVRLQIDVDLSSRIATKLRRHQIDIAFLPGAITLPGVLKTDLGACTLEWMAGPSLMHDRDPGSLTAADIAQLPIITLSQEANSHAVMVNWFEKAGVKPTRVHYCNSSSVVASLVRKGVGISLFASELFQDDVLSGAMSVIPVTPAMPRINYSAAYIPATDLSLAAELSILPQIAEFAREESWFLHKSKLSNAGNWTNVQR
jgi:DNA-binding transcriptional LysR family regulator